MSFLVNSYRYLAPGATLTADAGTFTLTGVNAAFLRALRMQAAAGSFTLTGNDAGLFTGNPDLIAETGTFTLTGNAAALSRALRMAASAGTFSLTGNAATLTYGAGSDPHFSNVVLLCGFNGVDGATSTSDESSAAHSITFNGNAQLDTAQTKFGSASLLLDGAGDYLTCADSADWDFGAGQFTVETWVRFSSGLGTHEAFIGQWGATFAETGWFLFMEAGALIFRFLDTGGTYREVSVAWSPTVNTWYHLAADRDASGKVRIYRDGLMVASATLSQAMQNATGLFGIGRVPGFPTYDLGGWIDEIRITKGVARYASDSGFTVPTAAFPRS